MKRTETRAIKVAGLQIGGPNKVVIQLADSTENANGFDGVTG